ncbi:MAG TPA: amino acid adenylation domain-containing protein [Candidatus Limnocylindrales bacterium]|nr:amino acid adenylation domain-containing protein [Candidatus Limnocylindrales bacterium]
MTIMDNVSALELMLRQENGAIVPASYGQRRLWLLEQLFPGTAVYTVNTVVRLDGTVDETALRKAFDDLAQRHEALRTIFPTVGGEAVQLITPDSRIVFETADAATVEEADRILDEAAQQPFDLALGPLLRPLLVRIAGGDHRLLLHVHHIIVDGWSMGLLVRDLVNLYSGAMTNASPVAPYREFVAWQDARLESAEASTMRDYWRQRLAGPLGVVRLPGDRPRPAHRGTGGDVVGFTFPAHVVNRMRDLGQTLRVTPYMVLLATFGVLLRRYSDETDVIVASPMANRLRKEFEDTIGYLGNTVPMRLDLSTDPTFTELLDQVRTVALEAFSNQDIPFDMIVEDVAPPREADITPVCQAMLVVQNDPIAVPYGAQVWPIHSGTSKYDLTMNVAERDGALLGHLEFSTDLFDKATIERLADNFVHLLTDALNRPDTPIETLELVSAAELEILRSWNTTAAESPVHLPVTQIFDEVVAAHAGAIAVVGLDRSWTYAELADASNGLAALLREHGVGPGNFVGLAVERSFASVAWTLATLKAGAAYVPLDPSYPDERLRYIAADTGMAVLVGTPETAQRIGFDPGQVLAPDAPFRPHQRVTIGVGGDDPAYVIYTSGSTGTPKGVMVPHRGIVRLVCGANFFQVTPQDTVTHLVPLTFDGSVMEMFGALLNGGRLVLAPPVLGTMDDYCDLLESNGVTVSGLTSGLFPYLEEKHHKRLGRLRYMLTGGDVLSTRAAREFLANVPGCKLLNVYGPTENATATTTHPVSLEHDWSRSIPIGKPISNTTVYILDPSGQPTPIGVPGELYTGGLGVALGYLNLPEATRERFVPDPWATSGGTMYRTGDRARWLADGTIEFLGRFDHQVQIRSFRVELGEIQACLCEHPSVSQALVTTYDDLDGHKRLATFIVAPPESIMEIRGYVEARLPRYMVPTMFIPVPGLPLNAHGKVDLSALPDPATLGGESAGAGFAEPTTPAEKQLAKIWAEQLHLEQVGIDDDFFFLGGDSIIGIQIVAQARRNGLIVTPRMLLEGRTVRRIAAGIDYDAPAVSVVTEANLDGPFPLTPIQRWFVSQPLAHRDHFNMSRLFDLAPGTTAETMAAALEAVIEHHDALRLRTDGKTQHYGDVAQVEAHLEVVKLSGLPAERQAERLSHHAAEIQRELSLSGGPIVRALFADYGAAHPPAMLLVVHHFAVDGISWRILIEDLRTAYAQVSAGEPVSLPDKTTPFKLWAEALAGLQDDPVTVAKGRYWIEGLPDEVDPLPVDLAGGRNTRDLAATVEVVLGEAQTEALLREVPRAYGSQIDEVLLAALTTTVTEWTGSDGVLLALEGHGREDIVAGLDLSRTVGWFTSAYPVMLRPGEGGLRAAVAAIGEQLRAVPDRGLPHGILLYGESEVAQALRALPPPQISFNYMGRFGSTTPDPSGINVSLADLGGDRDAEGPRPMLLEVNAEISGGRLRVAWTYSTECHSEDTVRALAQGHLDRLGEIIRQGAGSEVEPAQRWDLTAMQQGLLVHSLYAGQDGLYVVQWCGEFQYLDGEVFEQACQRIVDRHDALRVAFDWADPAAPAQIVRPRAFLPVERSDWSALSPAEQEGRLAEFLAQDRARGFDLAVAPLMRVALLRLSEDRTQVVLSYHHALADGWAIGIVMDDLTRIYRGLMKGREAVLAPPPSFGDHLAWLREQDPAAAQGFWSEYLAGVGGPTRLGVERTGPCPDGERVARQSRELSTEDTAALTAAARGAEVTLNILCLGAWAVTASRYSATTDIVVGVTSAGRPAGVPGVERMVGLFINTLPVRVGVDPAATVGPWLRGLQASYWRVNEFEYSALADVQRWSGADPQAGLFEHIFVFENYPDSATGANPWGDADLLRQRTVERIGYPLDVTIKPGPQLVLELNYDRARYDDQTIAALLDHYEAALHSMTRSASLHQVALTAAGEREAIIERFIPPYSTTEESARVQAAFEHWAVTNPDMPAVTYKGVTLTYDGLNQRANALARHLVSLGAGPGVFVGIASTRCVEMLVGILGILKAGAAYVPISHKYPPGRIGEMLTDVGIQTLITRRDLPDKLPRWPGQLVYLEDWATEPAQRLSDPDSGVKASDPCYVYFTSGSTGRPKGVVVTHGNLVATCRGYIKYYRLDEAGSTSVHLQMANMSFDVFTADWVRALSTGRRLVLCPAELLLDPPKLLELMTAEGVDFAEFVPVVLRLLADHLERTGARLDFLRVAVCGSDVWYGEEYERFQRLCGPQTRLVNSYGVTEATVDNAMFEIAPGSMALAAGRPVPVGGPAPDEQLIILDGDGVLSPLDVPGELCIGGAAVAGYLNRDDLNRERFAPNPFGQPGDMLYRTGDLARYCSHGYVELLGRGDDQIKIRGYRIEPGEVESVLRRHPDVDDALVAVARADGRDDARLIAYLVMRDGAEPNVSELDAFMAARVPWFMNPAAFVGLPRMPVSANGKVDRGALPPPPAARPRLDSEYVEPADELERNLAAIWREVLELDQVGAVDDFREMGGTSLRAMKIAVSVRAKYDVDVSIQDVAIYPNIREFAAYLRRRAS